MELQAFEVKHKAKQNNDGLCAQSQELPAWRTEGVLLEDEF